MQDSVSIEDYELRTIGGQTKGGGVELGKGQRDSGMVTAD